MWRLVLFAVLVAGCARQGEVSAAEPREQVAADTLMVGNSHTSMNGLFAMVGEALGKPGSTRVVSCAFLEDAAANPEVAKLIEGGGVRRIVLQGQKISSSHKYTYSTAEGEKIALLAKKHGVEVFWFAEWPRKGVAETGYIEDIYRGMATRSCGKVIPVGRVFDRVLKSVPGVQLWSADGNHASKLGSSVGAVTVATWLKAGAEVDSGVLARSGWDSAGQKSVMEAVRAVWKADHPESDSVRAGRSTSGN